MRKSIFSTGQEELQNLLRELRENAKLTQKDVARRLRQPQSFVSKYESGERRLDLLELREVCNALGIPVTNFVKRFERRLK
jgi:transcriptional regulator with XRE-family HTH domain